MRNKNVIFITGAASGIGAALAKLFVYRGDSVVLADINYPGVQTLAQELGRNAHPLCLDVRSDEEWQQTLNAAWEHFGQVDVLINNAATLFPGYARDLPLSQHRMTLDVNVMGPVTGMLAILPRFKSQGYGHLVTVASMTSFIPFPGLASYAAGKHALRAFHHSLALEERSSPIKFTIFHPASVETAMLDAQIAAKDLSTALAFSEKSYTARHVAELIIKAMDENALETVMPARLGRLTRFAAGLPKQFRKILIQGETKGRSALAQRQVNSSDD
jgi:short-subunit dehydrogenase